LRRRTIVTTVDQVGLRVSGVLMMVVFAGVVNVKVGEMHVIVAKWWS